MVDRDSCVSISRQCALLDLPRSTLYYRPATESAENLALMRLIDAQYLKTPYYGVGMMTAYLRLAGYRVNPKRIRRLYTLLGLQGIAPGPTTSRPAPAHTIYPYLLRNVPIERANQVWSSDITYVPVVGGFFYVVAVIDWFSRFVLSWGMSNSLDAGFCCQALEEALERYGTPDVFNSDQGAQFTSRRFTGVLKQRAVAISMDGRGRALDNVFIERLWRSYKYEYVYLENPENGRQLYDGTCRYFRHFNTERPHSALAGQTPTMIYRMDNDLAHG